MRYKSGLSEYQPDKNVFIDDIRTKNYIKKEITDHNIDR